MPRRHRMLPVGGLVLVLAVVGCYSLAEPSLRPGDSRDILLALDRRGVVVESVLAGESACDDAGLVANAVRLTASTPSDPVGRDVFIYSFRANSWDDSARAVEACQAAYAADNPSADIVRVDVPTYRAFGPDWSNELTAAVQAALEEASKQG